MLKPQHIVYMQVKKKQKHKSKGSVRTVTKQVHAQPLSEGVKNDHECHQVKADSFFNFFEPPTIPDDPKAEVDEDTQVIHKNLSDIKMGSTVGTLTM